MATPNKGESMGYTTCFYGEFEVDKPLEEKHIVYLQRFNQTRRMKRDAKIVEMLTDPLAQFWHKVRSNVNLPIGLEGAYFVGGAGFMGQGDDKSVVEHNSPPEGQPGLWCQWTASDDGKYIVWDGGEKFYEYVNWLRYIIDHFLEPWGYKINGEVNWVGEENEDLGLIVVKDNVVEVKYGQVVYR